MIYEITETELEIWTPGKFPPVDTFPILKCIPERWASWKSICRNLRHKQTTFYSRLAQECRDRVADRQATDSSAFVDDLVRQQNDLGLTDHMVTYAI
jgi:hypothetical protein